MKITRYSLLSGKLHSMEIDVTNEQIRNYLDGMLIQRAMPNISNEEREFILSGITPEEWNRTFAEETENEE